MTPSKSSEIQAFRQRLNALFKDFEAAYPQLGKEFMRDRERLFRCLQSRGLATLLLDLPTIDAALLDCIENGLLQCPFFLSKKRSRSDTRPAFLHGLWSLIVDSDCALKEDADPTAILFVRQISCFAKKLEKDCTDDRISATFEEYYSIEDSLREPSLDWEDPWSAYQRLIPVRFNDVRMFPNKEHRDFLERLDRVAAIVCASFGMFNPKEHGRAKHGPGAVSERFELSKFEFPDWPQKLAVLFDEDDTTGIPRHRDTHPVQFSKLISVPKTAKGPRLVAAEPIANMWIQQKISDFLCDPKNGSIVHSFFDRRRQSLSGRMVLRASADRSLATIDLSSASDRLCCWHIERLWKVNPTILSALIASRTSLVHDPLNGDITSIKKFAAQGSALTFPIQSIFFLCVALAALGCKTREDIKSLRGKVRVFGDDIIVPNSGYDKVVSALTLLELKVNLGKSFHKGYFRESCGVDAFRGYDVTPVKPKHLHTSAASAVQAMLDSSNNFFKKGFWNLASCLDAELRPILGPQPILHQRAASDEDLSPLKGSAGLLSFSGTKIDHLSRRYNRRYQVYERVFRSYLTKARNTHLAGDVALSMFWNLPYRPDKPRIAEVTTRRVSTLEAVRIDEKRLAGTPVMGLGLQIRSS